MYLGNNNCSRCGGSDPNCYVCHDIEPAKKRITPQQKGLHGQRHTLMSFHDAITRLSTNNKQTKTMAKKDTTPTDIAATPPTTPDVGAAKAAGKPGRPAGQSTKDGDVFKSNLPQPQVKMAPQALAIAKLVEAADTKGITRKELVSQMEGVVVTRQPQGRILSYYQKALTEAGFFTITPEAPVVEKNEAAVASA